MFLYRNERCSIPELCCLSLLKSQLLQLGTSTGFHGTDQCYCSLLSCQELSRATTLNVIVFQSCVVFHYSRASYYKLRYQSVQVTMALTSVLLFTPQISCQELSRATTLNVIVFQNCVVCHYSRASHSSWEPTQATMALTSVLLFSPHLSRTVKSH